MMRIDKGCARIQGGLAAGILLSLAGFTAPAEARITRIEITNVQSPSFDGLAFGTVGQYEKLVGRAYGEVDPKDPLNSLITDITLAPKNARGMV
ncbi:MAG: hypothetical protein JO124_02210, partial [Hyphomicrobiales bacterium]|nr:hypothetical protein [Hyphomicrobiales bacterium]